MRSVRNLCGFVALLVLAAPVWACLWDSDTLATEASGLPHIVRIITGRFERNPALYYEMRLARVAKELTSTPENLGLYDDAGVACDRLGHGDDAIDWMVKKRKPLEAAGSQSPEVADHWYRYHANLGTFLIHRWIKNGADRTKMEDVKASRDAIAEAIKINPNAHFGREIWQLKAIEWILDPPTPEYPPAGPLTFPAEKSAKAQQAAVEGIAGLVALGNGWESVDIFNALNKAIYQDGERTSLAHWANFRAKELILAGRHSLHPAAVQDKTLVDRLYQPFSGITRYKELELEYATYRDEADAWHKARTDYMLKRLQAGRHPDTDPTFWEEYTEATAPPLSDEMRNPVTFLETPVVQIPLSDEKSNPVTFLGTTVVEIPQPLSWFQRALILLVPLISVPIVITLLLHSRARTRLPAKLQGLMGRRIAG